MHNWRIETLISKTGKSSKKISMYVNQKTLTKREIWKKFTESLSYEKIANLLNELGDEDNEVLLEKMMEIIKKKRNPSFRKTIKIWDTYIIVGFLEKYSFKDSEWQLNLLSSFYN